MHGLGFLSSWSNYKNAQSILTPPIIYANLDHQPSVQFEGFVEYAFDRSLRLTNYPTTYPTNLTAEMIEEFNALGSNFSTSADIVTAFLASPGVTIAQYMYGNATQKGTFQQALPPSSPQMSSTPNNASGPLIVLDTSFVPFIQSSSLSHVDADLYECTADFLMRYATPPGKSLSDFVAAYSTDSDANYGPFGPGLRYILAGIGYRVRGGIPSGGSLFNNGTTNNGTRTSNPLGGSCGIRIQPFATVLTSVYWIILGTVLMLFM